MTEGELDYWRGEIATTILGCHMRMKSDDNEYEEEMKAFGSIVELASKQLEGRNEQ